MSMLQILRQQAKPHKERQKTWMCRLCGEYDIKLKKSHLVKVHKADYKRLTKRSVKGMLYEIFGEPCQ